VTPNLALNAPSRRTLAWIAGGAVAVIAIVAGVISPVLIVGVPLALLAGLVVLRHPWFGLALLIASVPVQQFGEVAGLTATRGAIAISLVACLATLIVRRDPIILSRMTVPFGALLIWMMWSAVSARDQLASAAELFRWTTALLAFLLAIQFLLNSNPRRITGTIVVMAIAGAGEAVIGTVLGLLSVGPASFMVGSSFSRAYGTFGRPNSFAGYLEMTVFPVAWFAVYQGTVAIDDLHAYREARLQGYARSDAQRRRLYRSLAILLVLAGSTLVMLAGIGVSYSRGAWLGVAAGAAASGALWLRRYWIHALAIAPLVLLLGATTLVQIAPSSLTERLGSIVDEARPFDAASITITPENFAVAERMAHWQAGWHMFEDNPLDGVGIGNFNANYPYYYVRESFMQSQGHAHNYYIHTLSETGIVGLFLYVTLAFGFLVLAVRVAAAAPDGKARYLALGATGTLTAVYVHNVFEDLHVLNLGIQISAVWGLAVVADRIWRTVPNRTSDVEYSAE
jgi:O-antigen ligase